MDIPLRTPFEPSCLEDLVNIGGEHWLTYLSAITVLLLTSGMMAMWLKEHNITFWKHFSFGFHRWVLIWEDPHCCCLVSGSC